MVRAVGRSHLAEHAPPFARRAAYLCDVTYATANEVGFDYLRDGLARNTGEIVQRPFAFAVIDEADSILIDEARIPLVIAGGTPDDPALAYRVDSVVVQLRPHAHYFVDEFARNVQLTDCRHLVRWREPSAAEACSTSAICGF